MFDLVDSCYSFALLSKHNVEWGMSDSCALSLQISGLCYLYLRHLNIFGTTMELNGREKLEISRFGDADYTF